MDIKDHFHLREKNQMRHVVATRLQEKLRLIKNNRVKYRRRWFWELLQNACDYNDSVNVQLVIEKEKLTFKHDGVCFSVDDVINVIRPNSDKSEDQVHKDNIGKFGSGLISTHILSSTITVQGVVRNNSEKDEYHEFKFIANRESFQNREKLVDEIQNEIDQFDKSLELCSCDLRNTSFTYDLTKPFPEINQVKYEDLGINNIYRMLPYVLCFIPKITSVKIIDTLKKNEFYICRSQNKSKQLVCFNITEGKKPTRDVTMKYFKKGSIESVFEIENNSIVPYPINMPKIFCGLPLIGSEKHGVPIIINSLKFQPADERDGIEIDPECNSLNESLISKSIDLLGDILDYIQENDIHNGYEVLNITNYFSGTVESRNHFKDHIIPSYISKVNEYSVVYTVDNNRLPISDVKIPQGKNGNEDEELYRLGVFFNESIFPKNYLGWKKAISKELFEDTFYNYEDLAYDIEYSGTLLEDVQHHLDCTNYLLEQDNNIIRSYKILPNQKGKLKYSGDLRIAKNLPRVLLEINNKLDDFKLKDELLDKRFNKIVKIENYNVCDLAKRVDTLIHDNYIDNDSIIEDEMKPLINELYVWIKNSKIELEQLKNLFSWFYPKMASLLTDIMSDEERAKSIQIMQSGKLDALLSLATSEITSEQILEIANFILCKDVVDDKSFADVTTGDMGEELVFNDLKKKFKGEDGYEVIWSSRDKSEPRYDFCIKRHGEIVRYYDAKTTLRGKDNSDAIPLFIRKSQWQFLKENQTYPYYIARVFLGDNKIEYMQVSLNND